MSCFETISRSLCYEIFFPSCSFHVVSYTIMHNLLVISLHNTLYQNLLEWGCRRSFCLGHRGWLRQWKTTPIAIYGKFWIKSYIAVLRYASSGHLPSGQRWRTLHFSGSFSFSSKMVNSKACIVHLHILLIYLLMKPGCDAKRQNVSQIIKYRLQKIMYQPYLDKMYKMLLPPRCRKEQNCFLQLMKLLRVRIKHPGKGVRMKLRIGWNVVWDN